MNLGEKPRRKWVIGRAAAEAVDEEEGSLKNEDMVTKKEGRVGVAAAIAETPGEKISMT